MHLFHWPCSFKESWLIQRDHKGQRWSKDMSEWHKVCGTRAGTSSLRGCSGRCLATTITRKSVCSIAAGFDWIFQSEDMWDMTGQHWESPMDDQFTGDSCQLRRAAAACFMTCSLHPLSYQPTTLFHPMPHYRLSSACLTGYIICLSLF